MSLSERLNFSFADSKALVFIVFKRSVYLSVLSYVRLGGYFFKVSAILVQLLSKVAPIFVALFHRMSYFRAFV